MTRPTLAALVTLALIPAPARADGPADNVPASVRRIPKAGIALAPEVRKELESGLADLRAAIDRAARPRFSDGRDPLPDVEVCYRAVHDALVYDEFFAPNEVDKARDLLRFAKQRAAEIHEGRPEWPEHTGLIVRGYRSKIDGSVQPYGLVIPEARAPAGGYRLDVWFHGRGETLSELNFLDERRKRYGEFSPPGTIVLHPYGRYCNAFKFAGEVDVLEAIDAVRQNYPIDPDRVAVRGFSMGGAACWQFAVHQSDRWFAANPGAGFAETPRFLRVFQNEKVQPTWYEKKLWHLYDCTDWAENLAQCPTVAYSGELDAQKQAADVMAEALEKEGIDLVHVIGPKTRHAYHPAAKVEVERRLASLAEAGRARFPKSVRFTTYTLKYNRMNWLTVDALGEHWTKARVKAEVWTRVSPRVIVEPENVEAFTIEFPPGFAPKADEPGEPLGVEVRKPGAEGFGETFQPFKSPRSDRSWSVSLHRSAGKWVLGRRPDDRLSKSHDLQGPIDDAFMGPFLVVRPTGRSPRARFQEWSAKEMDRAVEHWRRHFRGAARVKDDTAVSDADIASSNLVLWGDPQSNALLAKVADRLPIRWTPDAITAGDRRFDAENHALILVYPNPLNPSRYVVLNSGFTFRDYDYLNNARQVPKLPDWAVIDLRTPPDSRFPGKVVAADFFGERWELRPERAGE
jgi:dienelactone hydrolase